MAHANFGGANPPTQDKSRTPLHRKISRWLFQSDEQDELRIRLSNIETKIDALTKSFLINSEVSKRSINEVKSDLSLLSDSLLKILIDHDNILNRKLDRITRKSFELFEESLHAHLVRDLHLATFPPYKDLYRERDVVLMGAGPTLVRYEPIANAIHIGVNRVFQYDKVHLDYLFAHDYHAVKEFLPSIINYERGKCAKFFGIFPTPSRTTNIPGMLALSANAKRYIVGSDLARYKFFADISRYPLGDAGSVAFAAANFAMYTHPKRLYIVGMDNDTNGYFSGDQQFSPDDAKMVSTYHSMIRSCRKGWELFKTFCEIWYPETEVLCINPVGLKGIFPEINNG